MTSIGWCGLHDRSLVVQAAAGPSLIVGRRKVVSFASFNYLGLNRHAAVQRAMVGAMKRYGMTLAMPRSLATTEETLQLERELARLVGQERALLFQSTTHAAIDVIPILAGRSGLILIDQGAYAISQQAASQARNAGAELVSFAHNDCASLWRALRAQPLARRKLVVCDGMYSADGRPAPLREFAAFAARYNAFIYVDDAHGLGILGAAPSAGLPYGRGGGGVALHQGAPRERILYVSSLSKAFGVPVAFAAGSARLIRNIERKAGSLVHCSPSALPLLAAARAVLCLNAIYGDDRRRRILANVRLFRSTLRRRGIAVAPGAVSPLQTVRIESGMRTLQALRAKGMHAIVQCAGCSRHGPAGCDGECVLRCIVTADHTRAQVIALTDVLTASAAENR